MAVSLAKPERDIQIATGNGSLVILDIDWDLLANPHRYCDHVVQCPIGVDHGLNRKSYIDGQQR